jgi:maleate isomerase
MGVVVLKTDETMEGDLRAFLPSDGVALYHTRIPFEPIVTPETLARMEEDLTASVAMLPESAPFNVIGYGCTSASAVIGEDRIAQRVAAVYPNTAVTNPLTAANAALNSLDAKRIGLVTPYVPDVSKAIVQRFDDAGVETVVLASFEQKEDAVVARITPQSLLDAIVKVGSENKVDAVFASCTSLRTATVIAKAEAILGIPVLSSNQSLAWHMLRLAGLNDSPKNIGRLGLV